MSVVSVSSRAARGPLLAAAAFALSSVPAPAAAQAITASDFVETAPQGFGDRHNSHTWATAWWRGKLYVGTGRATFCVQQAMVAYLRPDLGSYPPGEAEVDCEPDPHDIPLQAEIWTWTPETNTWDLVYRSPNDVPIAGTDPQKYTARDIGYRGMLVFREQDGTEALYVSGVASRGDKGDGFNGHVPPPRILRSTDGVTFTPIPQDPGTVLGDTLVSGFRNLVRYNDKLYVIGSVGLLGHGLIYAAANPELGNDAFRQVSPPGKTFFEMEAYNGFLYAGTGVQPQNDPTPFSVLKTDGEGDAPVFTTIIPEGAYQRRNPSSAVISMQEFKGRLYLGTDREVLRINPDDTWDLVVGARRSTPDGHLLEPLSGYDIGFDYLFNVHMWRMTVFDGELLVGTNDPSTKWRNVLGSGFLRPRMGADLFGSADGWNFSMITRDGLGDIYNTGVRALAPTPFGLILGSANHYYGTRVYRAAPEARVVDAPRRLSAEAAGRLALLSWEASAGATRYHVFRDSGFGTEEEIAVVDATRPIQTYLDTTVDRLKRYHYFVVAEAAPGQLSRPSVTAVFPYEGPRPTFDSLAAQLAAWSAPAEWTDGLARTRRLVGLHKMGRAVRQLARLRQTVQAPSAVVSWRVEDLDVLLARFQRRLKLVRAGALPETSLEQ
jgi:hypothetical protein